MSKPTTPPFPNKQFNSQDEYIDFCRAQTKRLGISIAGGAAYALKKVLDKETAIPMPVVKPVKSLTIDGFSLDGSYIGDGKKNRKVKFKKGQMNWGKPFLIKKEEPSE
jgi:hypothetical protein